MNSIYHLHYNNALFNESFTGGKKKKRILYDGHNFLLMVNETDCVADKERKIESVLERYHERESSELFKNLRRNITNNITVPLYLVYDNSSLIVNSDKILQFKYENDNNILINLYHTTKIYYYNKTVHIEYRLSKKYSQIVNESNFLDCSIEKPYNILCSVVVMSFMINNETNTYFYESNSNEIYTNENEISAINETIETILLEYFNISIQEDEVAYMLIPKLSIRNFLMEKTNLILLIVLSIDSLSIISIFVTVILYRYGYFYPSEKNNQDNQINHKFFNKQSELNKPTKDVERIKREK